MKANHIKQTILWADDDPEDMEVFRDLIKASTFQPEVIEFSNGQELLNYLGEPNKQNLPCLIILDLNMPVLNGMETMKKIKSMPALKSIPVVVFTTYFSPTDEAIGEKYAVKMIMKPFSIEQLKAAIQKLLLFCTK
jgi:CheY-like chemotaxis protein